MRGRFLLIALLVAVPCLAACEPPAQAPPTPCYVGTFPLSSVTFTAPITTPFGPETVTMKSNGTAELTLTQSTWTLTTVAKKFTATGNFTGKVVVTTSANGAMTPTDTTMTFAVSGLTGTAHVVGTLNGAPVTQDVPSSYIDDLAELSGVATYSCSPGGLTLAFSSVSYEF